MKIVYTPLHGCGNKPVRRVLQSLGFEQVLVVPEQELPDGAFPTVKSPNPEERSALEMAIALAQKEGAELVIATDPDSDRTGLALRNASGGFDVLSGNQIGLLLMTYILDAKQKKGLLPVPEKAFCVTTIVSSKLPRLITQAYGVKLFETFTGFKFMAEVIQAYDENGDMDFQFAYEESFGYLAGKAVRDKDAVVTAMLLAEMAATAKCEGKSLQDYLAALYARYAYAEEASFSFVREGKAGLEAIAACMEALRAEKASCFEGLGLRRVKDYLTGEVLDRETGKSERLSMSGSNVLLYECGDLDFFCVRPSGTEPKIKVYFGAYAAKQAEAKARLEQLIAAVKEDVEARLNRCLAQA